MSRWARDELRKERNTLLSASRFFWRCFRIVQFLISYEKKMKEKTLAKLFTHQFIKIYTSFLCVCCFRLSSETTKIRRGHLIKYFSSTTFKSFKRFIGNWKFPSCGEKIKKLPTQAPERKQKNETTKSKLQHFYDFQQNSRAIPLKKIVSSRTKNHSKLLLCNKVSEREGERRQLAY